MLGEKSLSESVLTHSFEEQLKSHPFKPHIRQASLGCVYRGAISTPIDDNFGSAISTPIEGNILINRKKGVHLNLSERVSPSISKGIDISSKIVEKQKATNSESLFKAPLGHLKNERVWKEPEEHLTSTDYKGSQESLLPPASIPFAHPFVSATTTSSDPLSSEQLSINRSLTHSSDVLSPKQDYMSKSCNAPSIPIETPSKIHDEHRSTYHSAMHKEATDNIIPSIYSSNRLLFTTSSSSALQKLTCISSECVDIEVAESRVIPPPAEFSSATPPNDYSLRSTIEVTPEDKHVSLEPIATGNLPAALPSSVLSSSKLISSHHDNDDEPPPVCYATMPTSTSSTFILTEISNSDVLPSFPISTVSPIPSSKYSITPRQKFFEDLPSGMHSSLPSLSLSPGVLTTLHRPLTMVAHSHYTSPSRIHCTLPIHSDPSHTQFPSYSAECVLDIDGCSRLQSPFQVGCFFFFLRIRGTFGVIKM